MINSTLVGFIFIILIAILLFGLFVFFKSTKQLQFLLQRKYILEAETKSKIARRYLHEKVLNKDIIPIYHRLNDLKKSIKGLSGSSKTDSALRELEAVYEALAEMEESIRTISTNVYPPGLLKFFIEACNANIERIQELHSFSGSIHFTQEGSFELDERQEVLLFNMYSLIDLFVTNSIKHACAKNIYINISKKGAILKLIMQDDGNGFDLSKVEKKMEESSYNHRGIADIQGLAIACNPVIKEYSSLPQKGTNFKIIIDLKSN